MLLSIVYWLIGGIMLGGLANGARLGLPARRPDLPRGGWLTLGIGAGSALIGGLLGTWLLGSPLSTPAALMLGVVGAVAVPWIAGRVGRGKEQMQSG
jgi:hypothetical protein